MLEREPDGTSSGWAERMSIDRPKPDMASMPRSSAELPLQRPKDTREQQTMPKQQTSVSVAAVAAMGKAHTVFITATPTYHTPTTATPTTATPRCVPTKLWYDTEVGAKEVYAGLRH